MTRIYVVGSLRRGRVREVANELRERGFDVFDDWHAGGPDADAHWQSYEVERGRSYVEALGGRAADHAFSWDMQHLACADVVVLVSPPGKIGGFSSGLELGWAKGCKKRVYILLDGEPERWELMAKLVDDIFYTLPELLGAL